MIHSPKDGGLQSRLITDSPEDGGSKNLRKNIARILESLRSSASFLGHACPKDSQKEEIILSSFSIIYEATLKAQCNMRVE